MVKTATKMLEANMGLVGTGKIIQLQPETMGIL